MSSANRVHVSCPYCGADAPRPWGAEGGWTAVRCGACGFVYLSPRPPAEAISEAAQLGQHAVESGTLDVVGSFSRDKVQGLRMRLRDLWRPGDEPWQRRPCAWLDVGAGFGELVMAVSDLAGGEARLLGLEPCLPKVERARALGLEVRPGTLEEARAQGPWDVVSLVNVFSHIPDVHAFFGDIGSLVRPGGEVLVVTGNGADIERADYPQALSLPDHVAFAGQAHVVGVLERAGLRVQGVRAFETTLPRPRWEATLERAAAALLRRRVGYSRTAFRSLWVRARRPLPAGPLSEATPAPAGA